MKIYKVNFKSLYIVFGIILLVFSLFYPLIAENLFVGIIKRIKDAIFLGDSGHLILASALMSLLDAIKACSMFLGIIMVICFIDNKNFIKKINQFYLFISITFIYFIVSIMFFGFPQEIITFIIPAIICYFTYYKLFKKSNNFFILGLISFQVFWAFQWLNIIPYLSSYYIGQSDIPYSIKITGLYLNSQGVLNFTGIAFFIFLIFLAFTTSTLFISYNKNLKMIKENYENQREIQLMKGKMLESRINNEMKTLVHDLKTPLVTIRGLSSLLLISKDESKIKEYCERIDTSVDKMNEMISCFLYETSKQNIKVADLIDYVRAQLPLNEGGKIKIDIELSNNLPNLYVNKIRMARAIMNILENSMIATCKKEYKHIILRAKECDNGVYIIVEDNGVGIEEKDISKIFEMGYSTNNTSGLGLWFAKKVIEENEGKIDIKSFKDKGTIVTIYLPSAQNF